MASKMTCKNSPKDFYTGKEKSPLGKGFCADAEKVGVKMTGSDDKEWVVGLNKGKKLWIRAPEEKVKEPEPEPSDASDNDSDKDNDSDNDDGDSDSLRGPRATGLRRPPPIRQLLGLAGIVRLPKEGRLQRRRRQPDLPIHLDLAPP
jgi:hypothetical protein